MSYDSKPDEAILNNVAWCNAIADSHGIATHRQKSVWHCDHPMPPFYPNIITLSKDAQIDKLIKTIDSRLAPGWGIKDSFGNLDLSGKGFSLAFDANWYCRIPSPITNLKSSLAVNAVKTQSDLDRWVKAWGEEQRIFTSPLLQNTAVELILAEHNGRVVSGLATNQSGKSVGISNVFGLPNGILDCVADVARRHPEKVLVGYGDKEEIEILSTIGFREIGNLRVWLRR
ncbi:hypothetical protein AB833_18025 [Chromatiales bacterium (ex Bugula neritina AB1)]|nr:hypothetical protein AB833_18025 [Chromatiales bacterium (ex Bugula neritina AB1)]